MGSSRSRRHWGSGVARCCFRHSSIASNWTPCLPPEPASGSSMSGVTCGSNREMRKLPAAAPARSIGLRMGKAVFRASGRDYVPMGTPDFDLTQANTNISRLSQRILARQDFAAIATRRRANYTYLLARLQDIAPPIFGELPVGVCPLFYPFRSDRREALLGALRDQGVEIGEFWPDNHFYGANGEFPDADVLRRTALWLPCHQDLGAEALDSLVDAVRRAVAGAS